MSAFIESPTFSGWAASSFGSSAMRTGSRCTTLIQLPVAFCAGTMASAAAGAAGEADDPAVVDDLVAIEIASQFRGLAGADLGQLHFLEVGVDIGGLDRHDDHQRRAGLNIWPTWTSRLVTTPSMGARMTVRARSTFACSYWASAASRFALVVA